MFKNLFTRKPIFQITLTSIPTEEEFEKIKKDLKDELGDEYKVVIVIDTHNIHIQTKILK